MNKQWFLALTLWLLASGAEAADVQHGRQLFVSNCNMCHPGGENVLSPSKPLKGEGFRKAFPKDSMIAATIRNGIPNTVMTPFNKERLSDQQVSEIIAYVRTLTPPSKAGGRQSNVKRKPATNGVGPGMTKSVKPKSVAR